MTTTSATIKMVGLRQRIALILIPHGLLLVTSVGLFAYLLARFPFDGLTGQDSYAYYYQARELWDGFWGLPVPQWPFVGEGLYHWPVGYHLHLMLGFLFGGQSEVGGRLITLAMAVLTPLLVACLVGLLWHTASRLERSLAGAIAGAILLFTGIYNRASITLMADVPAIFWVTLAMCCLLRAWSPGREVIILSAGRVRWALASGASLGIAILLRYVSILLVAPVILYLLFWYRGNRLKSPSLVSGKIRLSLPILAAGASVCALIPQLAYTLTRATIQTGDSATSVVLSPGNFFKTTLSGPDGTQTFAHPMAAFYFLDPLYETSLGLLSPLYLPSLIVGVVVLFRQRNWGLVALVISWALLPPLFLSGGLYQAHRFVIMYLPPLAAFIGIGAVRFAHDIAEVVYRRGSLRKISTAGIGAAIALSIVAGLIQSARASNMLASDLALSKNRELEVITATKQAGTYPGATEGRPRAVVFGLSAAIYHYTGWPVLDIYNHDHDEIAQFLLGNGPRLAVVPEASMLTQWAGTPSGERWEWLRSHYRLVARGGAGEYRVYLIEVPCLRGAGLLKYYSPICSAAP